MYRCIDFLKQNNSSAAPDGNRKPQSRRHCSLERTHKAAGAIMMTGGAAVFYVGPCAASEWVHALTRGARPIPSSDTLESGVALKYTI